MHRRKWCGRSSPTVPAAPRVKQVFHLTPYEKDFGYSQAVLIDKTLYISGSVAADQNGRLVAPGDMAGQMRAAYSNIRRTLAAHGADFDEVVKETIYTTNMDALLKASDCGSSITTRSGCRRPPGYRCSAWWTRAFWLKSRSSPNCRKSRIEEPRT
jgi:enamine deaminase RidA (YjgF/YER057c/UK114 family)